MIVPILEMITKVREKKFQKTNLLFFSPSYSDFQFWASCSIPLYQVTLEASNRNIIHMGDQNGVRGVFWGECEGLGEQKVQVWTSGMSGSRSSNNAMGTLGLYFSAFEKSSGRLSLRSDKDGHQLLAGSQKNTLLLEF